ncbi:MAG: aldehyde dehydrogenase family protein [Candidatus Gracilibacteria bacterium]|nr:aldehyde dehydrogenase family protein [Candidatus Gracilibacteria bacterium]
MGSKSINPTTGETIFEAPYISEAELAVKIETAAKAYKAWRDTPLAEKQRLFTALAEVLESQKGELAKIDTLEMGMPIGDAGGDVAKSIGTIKYFRDNAEKLLSPKVFDEGGAKGRIVYEPLGVLYCVTPWNFPFNQVIRSTIPNIIAGNTVLVKHASNVPQAAIALEAAFLKAGFPEGVYTNLLIPSSFSESIIANKAIVGVTLTGGDKAGRVIGSLAGKYLKPSVLELGGSDPFLVLDNARMDEIVKSAISGRMSNCGQKCNSSKRFIVLEKYYEEFCQKFAKGMSELVVGDPLELTTKVGPVAKEDMLEEIESQVADSIKAGAKLLTGGARLDRPGFFYTPTVLADAKPGVRAFDEEVFGPVAPVAMARDIEELISLANASRYGLGCSIFGDDRAQIDYVAARIEAGNIAINKIVTSYAFLPYGGIKDAGYGKELGEHGIKTFMNEKVIVEG